MNVKINRQGQLFSNTFIENPVIADISDEISYGVLVNSNGLAITNSSGEEIYLIHQGSDIPMSEMLEYLAGITSINEIALSGNVALLFSDTFAVANEFIEI